MRADLKRLKRDTDRGRRTSSSGRWLRTGNRISGSTETVVGIRLVPGAGSIVVIAGIGRAAVDKAPAAATRGSVLREDRRSTCRGCGRGVGCFVLVRQAALRTGCGHPQSDNSRSSSLTEHGLRQGCGFSAPRPSRRNRNRAQLRSLSLHPPVRHHQQVRLCHPRFAGSGPRDACDRHRHRALYERGRSDPDHAGSRGCRGQPYTLARHPERRRSRT